jgi:hypothetical protein
MNLRFCENLLVRIRERQGVYADRILSGTFDKIEDYKFVVGKWQAMREAEEIICRLYKDMFDTKYLSKEGNNEEFETD